MLEKIKNPIVIISAAAGVVVLVLVILFVKSRAEMQEMVEVFTEEKETLLHEYQDLYLDYDSLKSNNSDLNNKLEMERERIAQLQEELKTVKATNARRIRELQNELTTMRTVMRSFVKQIDSLNQRNIQLSNENKDMRKQVAQARQSYNQLAKENETLSEQVSIASRLETSYVSAQGLTFKEKKTTSCSKVSKIKISFGLMKNQTAQVGMRDVYVRITRPDGQLLMHSKSDTFEFENTQINYSAKRSVEYGGEATDSYVVYSVDAGELMGGSYEAELFCGGDRIGRCAFSLKD